MRRVVLLVLVAGLAIAGAVRWWTSRIQDATVTAHLTVSNICSEPGYHRFCRQIESDPLRIVLMPRTYTNSASPPYEPVLTSDSSGATSAHVHPGVYGLAMMQTGGAGFLTNKGGGVIRIVAGERLDLGTVEPAPNGPLPFGTF